MSLPAWECGLKFHISPYCRLSIASLPAWECGLKCVLIVWRTHVDFCHSLRGSVDWNLAKFKQIKRFHLSLPAWECGLKFCLGQCQYIYNRHSLRGSVDWNSFYVCFVICSLRHSLRGSVDWNFRLDMLYHSYKVTPCVGVWIEIYPVYPDCHDTMSLPAWECGLKSGLFRSLCAPTRSLPAWECGLKCNVIYYAR